MIMNNVNSNHNQKLVHYMRLDHKRKIYTFMDKKLTIDAFFASTRRTTSKQIGIFCCFLSVLAQIQYAFANVRRPKTTSRLDRCGCWNCIQIRKFAVRKEGQCAGNNKKQPIRRMEA